MVIFEKEVLDLMASPDKHILDVGYGWGVTSEYFYNKGVKSLTIIEIREDLYERALAWSWDKPNVHVFNGDWVDVLPNLHMKYDGIYMDTFCPKDEDFSRNKTKKQLKKMLDFFFEEPTEEEWNKYKSFEDYCKLIANEGCILSIYEYNKIRKDINFKIIPTDWGIEGYPTRHKLGWTYFSNGEFNKKDRIDAMEYLDSSVKSYQRQSPIHGVGLFALVDIKAGEQVFPLWKGETGWYKITRDELESLPVSVAAYILRSYTNDLHSNFKTLIEFRLVKDTNFLFSEPLALLNTAFTEGNINSNSGIALKDIKRDQELLGNYRASSQIKLI